MKVKFLGTAAAEGVPALYCECDVCTKSKKAGGKNIRTRPQALIDDTLLIDFGPDTYLHVLHQGLNLNKVKNLIITHSHSDHILGKELAMRCPPYSATVEGVLDVYGNSAVLKKILHDFYNESIDEKNCDKTIIPESFGFVSLTTLTEFIPFKADGYKITPLLATHKKTENCFVYLIEKNGKKILYGHDTGLLPKETLDYLKEIELDLVSMDCTMILINDGQNHMGLEDNVIFKSQLQENGNTRESTKFVINHFSHNGGLIHDELEPLAMKNYGFYTSFDGFEIEI